MASIPIAHHQSNEEAELWAALDKLSPADQLRTSVFRNEGSKLVDVTKLTKEERELLLERILYNTEEDNANFLQRLRDRLDRYFQQNLKSAIDL
jgi:hypothetical protein